MDFQGKVVVITGAASGIGEACVREFAARNATVAMVDRKPISERELAAHHHTGRPGCVLLRRLEFTACSGTRHRRNCFPFRANRYAG